MQRIWLNHWFSSAYNIINLIKENESDFYIIGSNRNINSVMKNVCDEWYQEPVLEGEAYVQFCINFCKEHEINLFVPRRGMLEISKYIYLFHEIGTKVMVDEYEIISLLNHKDKAYELFIKEGIGSVPEYGIVTNVEDFILEYRKLCKKYQQVCFKYVHDEGGQSFRLISNGKKGYESLFNNANSGILFDDVVEALQERKEFEPVMIMPYLPDQEVSVDCLKTEQGIIMLPREKGETRIEKLIFDENILSVCKTFYDKVELECPCNIQFKYLDGIPYFLEVNTRMSGGVQMACLAAGVNIPNIAVNKMLGVHKKWSYEKIEKYVSHVEMPIIV